MRCALFIFAIAFMFASVSAAVPVIDITIHNNTIYIIGNIQFETGMFTGKAAGNYMVPINESINLVQFCQNLTLNATGNMTANSTYQNCTATIDYSRSIFLSFNESNSVILTSSEAQAKYDSCVKEKESLSNGLSTCSKVRDEREDVFANYTRCSTDLAVCNSNTKNLEDKADIAQQTLDGSKNTKYLWALFAAAIASVLTLYLTGYWATRKKADQTQNFNQQQAA